MEGVKKIFLINFLYKNISKNIGQEKISCYNLFTCR